MKADSWWIGLSLAVWPGFVAAMPPDTPSALLAALERNIAATQFDGVRPLGDRNRPAHGPDGRLVTLPCGTPLSVGMTAADQRLTFSETVSYHLYYSVLAAEAARRHNDPERVAALLTDAAATWDWTRANMQRRGIEDVLCFDAGDRHLRRVPLPADARDALLAWRWIPEIGSAAGQALGDGIIIHTEDPRKAEHAWNRIFHDGLQPASDGELLVAWCLVRMAELTPDVAQARTWRDEARAIIADVRRLLVLDFQPGVLVAPGRVLPSNHLFSDSWTVDGRSGSITVRTHPSPETPVQFAGRQCCIGLAFPDVLDLRELAAIELRLSGSGRVELHLQDTTPADATRPHCGKTNPGRVVHHAWLLSATPRTVTVPMSRFRRFPYYGNQSGRFDYGSVASLVLQLPHAGTVNVHGIAIKLKPAGVSSEWAGRHLVHSAQGEPYINVSYWMPWVFEAFSAAEPEHARFWRALAERSHRFARKSSAIRLNAFPENDEPPPVMEGNGALVPNFFALHPLTGVPVNLPFEARHGMVGHVMGHDGFRTYYFIVKSLHEQQRAGQPLSPDGLRLLAAMADFLAPAVIDTEGRPPALLRMDGQPVGRDAAPVGMRAVYWALYEFLLTADPEAPAPYRQCISLLAASLREDLVVDPLQRRAWWTTQDPLWADAPQAEYFQQYWAYFGLRLVNAINPEALDSLGLPMPPGQHRTE